MTPEEHREMERRAAMRASLSLGYGERATPSRPGRITIGNYLLTRLKEAGVGHLVGVPGDFNLAFLEQVLATDGIQWVGTANELNAAYAADGYARVNGIGAMVVTYGVGDLSALNGIAGAHAEHVPVVCISGVPPLSAIDNRRPLHHTSGSGDFEDVMNCLMQFTVAQARLTPANAAIEIDRLIRTALREKRPVYLQLPSDIPYLEIEAPTEPIGASVYSGDPEQIERVVELMARRISEARRPALLVDADAHRFELRPLICALGERAGIPFASMASGRSIFNEQHPYYCGIYGGRASAPEALELVESSDCLISIGVRYFDATTCFFSQRIPIAHTIVLDAFRATIGNRVFEGITAHEVLAALAERLQVRRALLPLRAPRTRGWPEPTPNRITHARLWPRLERFLRERDIVVAETGTAQAGLAGIRMPAQSTFINQTTWGSIGYSLPALLGTMLAEPDRRHLLFIGDGSLQQTVQEMGTILNLGLKPIIFVINNLGYTIERVILGPEAAYNDIPNWRYAQLPHVLSTTQTVLTRTVTTEVELEATLNELEARHQQAPGNAAQHATQQMSQQAAPDAAAPLHSPTAFTLIELMMDKLDAPVGLKRMGPLVAEFDFGERGPQPHALAPGD